MQISELVTRSGVPLATVKFYIREGMLPPGEATGARRAEYTESHLERLTLIRSLVVVAGLPLGRARRILEIVDEPDDDVTEALGKAVDALVDGDAPSDDPSDVEEIYPLASAAMAALGPEFRRPTRHLTAFAQLDDALRAAQEVGMPIGRERLQLYARHIAAIARSEVGDLPMSPGEAVRVAVLGTTLYEPVLAALRRLAHQNLTTDDHSVSGL
jgi:DNA-binding transcriptional MerR regulator